MKLHLTKTLLAVLPLAGVLVVPLTVTARDDQQYEREERRTSTRMSDRDLRSFEAFLDAHDDTAQELYRDPELIKNERFLRGHSALRDWLDDHREAAQAIEADPRAVIWQERTATGREREEGRPTPARMSERDLQSFEDYLNSHDETAQELYRNPELINDRSYVREHKSLQDWLDDHREAAAAVQANPQQFLQRERSSTPQDVLRQLLK
jgi:hypothetical protein